MTETQQRKNLLFSNSSGILKRATSLGRELTLSEQVELARDMTLLEAIATRSDLSQLRNGASQESAREKPLFSSLGDQLQAIVNASRGGADRRLDELQRRAALGANEKVGSEGGFLVEDTFVRSIWLRMTNTDVILRRCLPVEIGANANGIVWPAIDETSRVDGSRWGGFRAYWSDEASTTTASKPRFRAVQAKAQPLRALCYVSDELLEDAPGLGAFMELLGGMELGFKLGVAVFSGNGAAQPLGILNSGALVTVNKETTQGAATIVRDNLVKMYSRLYAGARETSAWFVNQAVETQLYQSDLGTIFSPAGANGSKYCSLFGAPVVPVEACPALGTVGDIVLANLPDYMIASKPMDMATSIHVQFLTDESAFRFTLRCNGQPLIAAPLTPLNGTVTQSSFVALETRS